MKLTLLDLSEAKVLNQFGDNSPSTLDSPSPALVQSLIGFPSASGSIVTKDSAIRCVTFLSGVKRLADDIAKMPIITYERTEVDGRQRTRKAIDRAIYSVLKDVPNPWSTSFQLRWAMVFSLLTNGNYYVQKIENSLGEVVSLMHLNPWCVTQRWDLSKLDKNGNPVPQLLFDYTDGSAKPRTFTTDQLWWGSILGQSGIQGQAIITLGKEAIGIMIASDSTAGKFFANGLNMHGFLTSSNPDMEVGETEAQVIVDRLRDQNRINRGGFTYLPGGVKYEKMTFSAVEAQLLESRKWNAEEIIRLLGGAPLVVKLGYGDKNSTYAASSAFLEDYFSTSLLPITTLLEQTITRDLIDPKERSTVYAKHNADIMLRGSPKERAETNQILYNTSQRTGNELRDLDDLDPIDGNDYVHVNANCILQDGELITVGVRGVGNQDEPGVSDAAPVEQAPAPLAPTPAPTAKTQIPERVKMIVQGEAERLVRKETAQVEKLTNRGVDASEFYNDHADFIAQTLKISVEDAKAYCAKRKPDVQALMALALGE